MKPDQAIATLQRFVDRYAADLRTALSALSDSKTPEPARRALVGGLNYALDLLDLFPDHYKGLGVSDDALLLRLSAKAAVDAGAAHADLQLLAAEADEVHAIFGELGAPLAKFAVKLADRTVRGRTVDQILKDKDVFAVFSADIDRHIQAFHPEHIDTSVGGPERALKELTRMAEHALKKEKLL